MSEIQDYMQKTARQEERQKQISDLIIQDRLKTATTGDGQIDYVDKSFLYEEQYKNDAISIGEKKHWKPSDEQKRRNAKIDAGRALTKLATADTVEVQKIVQESAKWNFNEDDAFRYLMSVSFDARMLTSANIRANLGEYMRIYRCIDKVRGINIMGDFSGYAARYALIQDDAELFYDRIKAYVTANRVSPSNGEIMDDHEEAFQLDVDIEAIRQGNLMHGVVVDDYQLGDIQSVDVDLALGRLITEESDEDFEFDKKKIMSKPNLNEHYRYHDYKYYEYMGPTDGDFRLYKTYDTAAARINEIIEMREQLRFLRTAQKSGTVINAGIKYEASSTRRSGDILKAMAREEIELSARLLLAEAETRLLVAQKNDDAAAIEAAEKEVKAAWNDYRRIQIRNAKESMPLTAKGMGQTSMTHAEAISSKSDALNLEFKKDVSAAANALDENIPALKTVKDLAKEYSRQTHYTIGCEAETVLLRELKNAITAAVNAGHADALAPLKEQLSSLDKSLIPSYGDIPDELKAQYDFSGKPLQEVTGDKSEPGATRNAFMNNDIMREWVDMRDMPLFPHEPTINDLRQGKISNCYMLAATTSLIQHDPQAIKNIIRDNNDGTVTVRLFKDVGAPVYIRVDKVVPRLKTGGTIMTAGPLWMQLIEMAAAHVGMFKTAKKGKETINRSGIGSLWYGTGGFWFAMLTGSFDYPMVAEYVAQDKYLDFPAEDLDDEEDIYKAIRNAEADHFIYHLGTKGSTTAGLNSDHAYTVLGAKEINGEKYITLRNPYANMSYQTDPKGEVSMSSTYLSSSADSTHGQFDIPLYELMKNVKTITRTSTDSKSFMPEQKPIDMLLPDDVYDENGEPKYAITYPFGEHPTPEETMIAMLHTIAANGGYIPGTEHKEIEMLEFDDSGNIIGEEEKKEETEEETDDTIPADMREEVIENK